MNRHLKRLALWAVTFCLIGCQGQTQDEEHPALFTAPSIYHWKTTFKTDSTSLKFIEQHNIQRIYVRMFDVATEELTAEPIATTQFKSPIPQGVEVVPVVYITLEALQAMEHQEREYAKLIVDRLEAMCNHNDCGPIREMQFDCDWTAGTKEIYTALCGAAQGILQQRDMTLSITVRLHQLGETPPPADHGVLMLYNTGALKNRETRNSILDINDVRPYLSNKRHYPIPLAYAYPTFGWGVRFFGEYFNSIVSEQTIAKYKNEYIRYERATADEIMEVKKLVETTLGKPSYGNIIYHLDNSQLQQYTHDEISEILRY